MCSKQKTCYRITINVQLFHAPPRLNQKNYWSVKSVRHDRTPEFFPVW